MGLQPYAKTRNTIDDTEHIKEVVRAATASKENVLATRELLELAKVMGYRYTVVTELRALAGNIRAQQLLVQIEGRR